MDLGEVYRTNRFENIDQGAVEAWQTVIVLAVCHVFLVYYYFADNIYIEKFV